MDLSRTIAGLYEEKARLDRVIASLEQLGVNSFPVSITGARRGEIFRFVHHGFESPAAEFTAELRDHAERAGMVAPLVDFDVSAMARCRQNARRQIVVEIGRRFGV